MTPFLEQLAAAVGLLLGSVSVGAILVGAGKWMNARHAQDERESLQRGYLAEDVKRHDDDCTKDRAKMRQDLDDTMTTVNEIVVERRTERRLKGSK